MKSTIPCDGGLRLLTIAGLPALLALLTLVVSSASAGCDPVCGNGVVESGEQCDGTSVSNCPTGGCFASDDPDACTCCAAVDLCGTGEFPPCCDREASCVILEFATYGGTCHDPTCGPGDDCVSGQACVDGSCCFPTLGSLCFWGPSGGFIPCCAPAVCLPAAGGNWGTCQLPPG